MLPIGNMPKIKTGKFDAEKSIFYLMCIFAGVGAFFLFSWRDVIWIFTTSLGYSGVL
jgi:hypothetical protein